MQSTSQTISGIGNVDNSVIQMNRFKSYVAVVNDPNKEDLLKLLAIQDINENLETIMASSLFPSFLEQSMKVFLKILNEGEPHFIAEYNIQQIRKFILDILHRIPTNELLKPHVPMMLSITLKLLEIDNEDNVLVCLKIIIELHKQYRPPFSGEIKRFLQFVKTIYSELPKHMNKIFEPRAPIKVNDLSNIRIEELLKETFTMTTIQTEKQNKDGTLASYNLIPKAVLSLKVIQELPIIVVLMYQLYKQSVYNDVSEFIPLIVNTIILQPTPEQRQVENFNKEIFVDFMGAQIKTLSFLAYIIKIYQQIVSKHSEQLVSGMLGLLKLCPMEVAHLRRELLIASRHILATDLRDKFVTHMESLFDEDVLLGRGWTTHESLRPLAYSTLADLVHHVRHQLSLSDIARAVHLFSKNVHDDTLATTIQTMSCKLLLNLVECIKIRAEAEKSEYGRELLMRMLEVFVLKFKTIAKIQLPKMIEKCKPPPLILQSQLSQNGVVPPEGGQQRTTSESNDMIGVQGQNAANKLEEKSKFGFPQPMNYNVSDYRSLVKTLVCGVKTIAWGASGCKTSTTTAGMKQFQPHETLIFIRLVKWALRALDIYTLNVGPQVTGLARINQQTIRSKEEKEVLEHFSSVFSLMNPQTFHEIFSTTIEYVVERVYGNTTLQTVLNTLLANQTTTPIFATVLVEYLLARMEQMGSNQIDRSNMYLRLFKLVFGSVSLFSQENENMLRPHLHQIVNRSMELAMTAKEPYNYFLLLRSLFRSIGGGSHDLLYQEFLPLLPNLLEGLNRLQSGLHKQHMKDLFVELCLTVPVRLSSLLPYLPMLMDPLVSALNGQHVLISQGLRTLELCVDNLQHDFLYEHIQPVRADLMQALWRTLRNNDQVAQVAFKVLGKFGGGNRKMMIEPQKLNYMATDFDAPAIVVNFTEIRKTIEFPVEKLIETAFNALEQGKTDPFYRKQAWEVLHCYLIASLNLNDEKEDLCRLFSHKGFQDGETILLEKGASYKSVYKQARETHKTALIGVFVAAAVKELSNTVCLVMMSIVRHYTMVAVSQQAGPYATPPKPNEQVTLDPLVLVDALAVVMGHEEKELCKPGRIALQCIINTAADLLGSKQLACKLPMIEYLSEQMCALCYERAWYAKSGGCEAIALLIDTCHLKWVYEHVCTFLKALLFVMMDLTGEVSSGALDLAKDNLEKMLIVCVTPPTEQVDQATIEQQQQALCKVTHELVKLVTSPHTLVREQSMHSLRLLAEKQGITVTAVMEPFRNTLADMVPPIKHLLKHQPAIAQMGLMDGNMFCTTLSPRLFTIDVSIKEHLLFINDLNSICNTEDAKLTNISCYKSIGNFVPLRTSALKVLAACHYLEPTARDNIFQTLYRTLERPNPELQHTAFQCMKQFLAGYQVEKETIHLAIRPLLNTLADDKTVTLNGLKMLSYLTQLIPYIFKEKLCEELLKILKGLIKNLVEQHRVVTGVGKKGEEEQKIVTVISIFYQMQEATAKYVQLLVPLILKTEKDMMIEASSPFREVLMKFLLRFPAETLDLFLNESKIVDEKYSRYLLYLLKHSSGAPLREHIQNNLVNQLIILALVNSAPGRQKQHHLIAVQRNEMQFQSVRIVSVLVRFDKQWIGRQPRLIEAFRMLWCNDEYQKRHKNIDTLEYTHWKEPKLLVKILLQCFILNTNDIDLLFQLLRATCDRYLPEFQFLRDFLEFTVSQEYSVEWKRSAFFLFVEKFHSKDMSQELKAKVIQLILIPCFAVSFEKKETIKLIGSPPAPNQDSPTNIVSEFINKLIDPDNSFPYADCVRISLLQFSCLLVEQASAHIHDHDANNKTQGYKVRRLMTFAWPCLLGKNCVDAATRYHGHLLLSHIINKFAIHRKIVLQVFHSLLKAHGLEAKNVVRQALEILTPSIPLRIMEGNKMLTHWTKKIILDEGHSMQQLFHILQVVVKHCKVYYPVRHSLVAHMVNSIHRLGFSPTATLEHRKLAVELAEVIIRWELDGNKKENEGEPASIENQPTKRPSTDEYDPATKRFAAGTGAYSSTSSLNTSSGCSITSSTPSNISQGSITVSSGIQSISSASATGSDKLQLDLRSKPIDKIHTDTVLNCLLRLACQVNDVPTATAVAGTAAANQPAISGVISILPGEMLSRRCVLLLRTALKAGNWPQPVELKLAFFDKILMSVEPPPPPAPAPNIGNICTALELLTFLLSVLKEDQILRQFQPLQESIGACVKSNNNKIIKLVHTLLHKLMGIFPPTRSGNNTSNYKELEKLYFTVEKVIYEGFIKYENDETASSSSLFGTIMILKAACINNNSYIDLSITPFMRILQRLAREHLQSTTSESNLITSELLVLSLDLVKTRVVVMGAEMRKTFIGTILVSLIERTQDVKVMKAIVKMLEEWMKNKDVITLSQAPNLREKSILLVKLMQHVEKRFPDDIELNCQFLELVNFVYTDDALRQSELAPRLEPAFMAGLRCTQPHVRAKFFAVFDSSMRRRLYDRLMYITCSQNWDAIGSHYWIKQVIELLMVTAQDKTEIKMAHEGSILPSITSVAGLADMQPTNYNLDIKIEVKQELPDVDTTSSSSTSDSLPILTPILSSTSGYLDPGNSNSADSIEADRLLAIDRLVATQHAWIVSSRSVTTDQFLLAASQLCHWDTSLAETVWLAVFPKMWDILHPDQRKELTREIRAFVTSGTHIVQRDCHPSAINTFVEAMSRCNPPIQLEPSVMKYLGKSHNLWHRMALNLEHQAFDPSSVQKTAAACYDFDHDNSQKNEVLESLGDLYSLLCEDDMWAALWQRHALHYRETGAAISYEQHGFYEQAQQAYEAAMAKHKQETTVGPVSTSTQREVLLWYERWIRCTKELNQWDVLLEYSRNSPADYYLMLESSWRNWRLDNWDVMKEALSNVEYNCPKELAWKVTLYGGYLLICKSDDTKPPNLVERYVETATIMCLNEWRRLPHVVSHIHLQFLQAAQQIMELQEAYQIHKGLSQGHQNSLHDMKAIVKTWRNRLPVIADDLRHWNDIFTWRQHHYQFIVSKCQNARDTNSTMGVHASAQSIIHFGKMARKHKLANVCLDSLHTIYSIASVPVVDCFQKVRQQIKCYLLQASMSTTKQELHEGIEVINSTNVSLFSKEMITEFYALKGMLYHLSNRSDDANKAFSAAIQKHDASIKAWGLYGDYLEQVFTRDPVRQISLGVNAMTCFLHACRHQNEPKARKYLAKVLWMLSFDDKNSSLMETLDKYSVGVPPLLWLPWIAQLLNCMIHYDGNGILNLLLLVGKMYPQAVYFPIRTLYFTLRTATARTQSHNASLLTSHDPPTAMLAPTSVHHPHHHHTYHSSVTMDDGTTGTSGVSGGAGGGGGSGSGSGNIKAPPAMVRCKEIIKMQQEIHATVISSLEGIADQVEWFRENWYEEVVRQLRQGLAKCYAIAFENREAANETLVTPHILNFVKKIVSTFGIGVENITIPANTVFPSAASESLARRAEDTYQDPVFKEMKSEFTKDFDFTHANAMKLHLLIHKLKKWIKILENRSKMLMQSFLVEEKSRYLSNFTLKTSDLELPGEFLLPKHTHYYVRITRFMPRVDIVQKHNAAARRLYIRGHNGKIYPYLVVIDSGLADGRREERVLQLLRMMNLYLGKQKETARRFLHYTVPRVVAVSAQTRLVEDNPASISLLDVFKKGCTRLGIVHDTPIHHYYERLAAVQVLGTKVNYHTLYRDILSKVQSTMVPKTLLKQWAVSTFPSATDYWQFRKMFTLQMSLICFAEYVLHLTRLNPDMMYLHQDSGLVNVSYFKFDVDESTGELNATRPVPFRLTPNVIEFISTIGLNGPLAASMIAAARCIVYPNFKFGAILKPILRDEMRVVWSRVKKNDEQSQQLHAEIKQEKSDASRNEQLASVVTTAVAAITTRLNSLAQFDGLDSNVNTLVSAVSCQDNLCRMDPAWHPWL